jgi:hypothetical protein
MSKHTPYWYRVIKSAIARQNAGKVPFTEKHKALSKFWVTCACGKQDDRIPRDPGGGPIDFRLKILGLRFDALVSDQEPTKALMILHQIEQRAGEVLSEIQAMMSGN